MSACDIICDIICDTGTNIFILQQQLPLWLPPPCCVSLSPLPFFLPRWHDPAWQPPPPRWTLSGAVPVRSATARDSPCTVCCRSSDLAGCRQMLYQGFCCSWICRESLDGCCSLWSRGWGGLAPAHLPLGRCIGRAIAGCWQCRTAWAHLPVVWCCLGSDWWAQMCWNTQGHLLVVCWVFWTLAAPSTKGAVEKELWQCIPHQSISSQIKVTYNIEFSNRIRIVGERRQQDNNLLHKHTISHMMSYMISW